MLQEIFYGSHYEIGLHFGRKMYENKQKLLDKLPFALTQDRRDFAAACLPVYRQFFPEVLAEIAGLAQAQNCEAADIQAILFSMYALPPAEPCPQCSCLALSADGQILLGRNSDFLIALQELNMNVIYRFKPNSAQGTQTPAGFSGNTTAFIEMEDGVNAHGLALGLTSVAPAQVQPGFNAGLLLRCLLEKCRNCQEVVQTCQELPIASAQTIIAADTQGAIVLLEMCAQRTEVIWPKPNRPFVLAVNQFSAANLAACRNRQIDNWQATERRQTLERALQKRQGRLNLAQLQTLLAGGEGFLCQYDRRTGHDTVWSTVYDLANRSVYRAAGNPQRCPFKPDARFSW